MGYSIGPNGIDLNGTTLDGPEDLGASTNIEAVGTYLIAQCANGTRVGSTTAGTNLRRTPVNENSGKINGGFGQNGGHAGDIRNSTSYMPSGTWRNMGPNPANGQGFDHNQDNQMCLWVRVS